MGESSGILELQPDIFRINGYGANNHNYIIKGDYANLLIYSSVDANFPALQKSLLRVGLKIRDIDKSYPMRRIWKRLFRTQRRFYKVKKMLRSPVLERTMRERKKGNRYVKE